MTPTHPICLLLNLLAAIMLGQFFATGLFAAEIATPPAVGDAAPNFTLKTLDDKPAELKTIMEQQPVVLLVLRGWPGYHCPMRTKQVHDFVARAAEFKARGAQVVMVYPVRPSSCRPAPRNLSRTNRGPRILFA